MAHLDLILSLASLPQSSIVLRNYQGEQVLRSTTANVANAVGHRSKRLAMLVAHRRSLLLIKLRIDSSSIGLIAGTGTGTGGIILSALAVIVARGLHCLFQLLAAAGKLPTYGYTLLGSHRFSALSNIPCVEPVLRASQ